MKLLCLWCIYTFRPLDLMIICLDIGINMWALVDSDLTKYIIAILSLKFISHVVNSAVQDLRF